MSLSLVQSREGIVVLAGTNRADILDKALSDPQIFAREPKKAADFGKLRAKLAAELEDFENQWLEAQI